MKLVKEHIDFNRTGKPQDSLKVGFKYTIKKGSEYILNTNLKWHDTDGVEMWVPTKKIIKPTQEDMMAGTYLKVTGFDENLISFDTIEKNKGEGGNRVDADGDIIANLSATFVFDWFMENSKYFDKYEGE